MISSMNENEKYLWLEDRDENSWVAGKLNIILAKIHEVKENKYILHAFLNGEIIEYEVKKNNKSLREVAPSSLKEVEDLLKLTDVNEPILLHNIRYRFFNKKMYSFLGPNILISINQLNKDMNNVIQKNIFREKLSDLKVFKSSDPHLYQIAELSYNDVKSERKNQSIIISGESGSGKSDVTKKILKYLTICSKKTLVD